MSTIVTEQGDIVTIEVFEAGVTFTGAGGINGILSGTTAPASNLGNNGDFYINTVAKTIYGPKTAGLWGTATNYIGPQGSQGVQGEAGPQGPAGEDTNVTGFTINAAKELVLSIEGGSDLTFDMSPFIRLFVGDVEILKKADAGGDPAAIEDGDIIRFYDDANGDRKVEGIVRDAGVDVKTYNAGTKDYTNLRLYTNTSPGT